MWPVINSSAVIGWYILSSLNAVIATLKQHCNAKQGKTGNKQENPFVMKGGLFWKRNCFSLYPGTIAG